MEALKPFARKSTLILALTWLLAGAASAHAASIPVSLSMNPADGITPGQTINFKATAAGRGLTYEWFWDSTKADPQAPNGPQASHAFATHGFHYAGVRVSDSNGNSGIAYRRFPVGNPPVASFSEDNPSPQPGQTVTFTSTSVSPDSGGSIQSYAWDLNGDGNYDDATGTTATHTFNTPGTYWIGLKVIDDLGMVATTAQQISVSQPQPQHFDTPPPPPPPPSAPTNGLAQFNPKPFIRIKGHTTGRGAQIDLFSVRAPKGARIAVRCAGKRCQKHTSAVRVVRPKRGKVATLRFPALQGWFHAGTLLEVRVTKKGFVGRYTRFRVRRLKPPVRWDACLMPGAKGPTKC